MNTIAFKVPGTPVPQPRQRHRIVHGRGGQAFAHNYTPTRDPVNAFKATVRQVAEKHFLMPLNGPVCLYADFVLRRPDRLRRKKDPVERIPHDSSKDLDNLLKSVKDALKGIAYHDDKQVAGVVSFKWFSSLDEGEAVYIQIGRVPVWASSSAPNPAIS